MIWDAVVEAVSEVVSTARPFLHEHLVQKSLRREQEDIARFEKEYQKLLDSDASNNADFGHFLLRSLQEAGYAVPGMEGRTIEVPVEVLWAVGMLSIRKKRDDYLLQHIQFKE